MVTWLALFGANFTFIFLKAFQQRNVMGLHYVWVAPTSFCMAACEVLVIWRIATIGTGSDLVLAIITLGLAGSLGCLAGMWVHNWRVSP